jgi:gamma-glutamylcysteine synthetase
MGMEDISMNNIGNGIEKKMRADILFDEKYLSNRRHSKMHRVGAEFEFPLLHLDRTPTNPAFSVKLADFLKNKFGFYVAGRTLDGFPFDMYTESRDRFSFDTTFNTIEFSMREENSLNTLADTFRTYYYAAREFALTCGYDFGSSGTHPYAEYIDPTPLNTPRNNVKSAFLINETPCHTDRLYFNYSAATHTHLDAEQDTLVKLFNVFNKLMFLDAYLFGNSRILPDSILRQYPFYTDTPKETVCFRDALWRNAGITDSIVHDSDFCSLDDLKKHMMDMNLFYVHDQEDGYQVIPPQSFRDYFNDSDHPKEDTDCFRSLEYVALTQYGSVEIRATCCQPIRQALIPVAFYLGLSANIEKAHARVEAFFDAHQVKLPYSKLREIAAGGAYVVDPTIQKMFANECMEIAYEGLYERGLGEEKLLSPVE